MSESATPPLEEQQARARERQRRRVAEIQEARGRWGERLLILAHHYQRPEIVALGDIRGDSFALSAQAARAREAEWILFCGVHFMAESAEVLSRDDQRVFHPNLNAGCPMADMAELGQVERAWAELQEVPGAKTVVPLTYMNSAADLKAFCGTHGGAVCTSSNARQVVEWALGRGERVLFFPDQHLARNTGRALGMSEEEMPLWDPARPLGGLRGEQVKRARLLLWKGYCHVHTWFTPGHVAQARSRWPGARVVVHPECPAEVVEAADGAGSTGYLVREVQEAEPGSVTVVGTEQNLVRRLAMEHPDRTVVPLARSLCPNMFRINLVNLHRVIMSLPEGSPGNLIQVAPEVKAGARVALERMLELVA